MPESYIVCRLFQSINPIKVIIKQAPHNQSYPNMINTHNAPYKTRKTHKRQATLFVSAYIRDSMELSIEHDDCCDTRSTDDYY